MSSVAPEGRVVTTNTAQSSVLPVPGGPYPYAAEAREWGPATYAKVLTLVLLPCAAIVGVGFAVGQPWTAGVIAAAPIALLVLWRPEIGVLVLALYVPFECFGRIGPSATLTKFLGIFTLVALAVHFLARRQVRQPAALWLAIGFAGWSGLTIMVARNPDWAMVAWFTRIQMAGLFFLCLNACEKRPQTEAFLWSLFLGAVFAAVGAMFLTPAPEYPGHPEILVRATVGGQNINAHAKDLLPGLFLMPFLFARARRLVRLLVFVGLLVVLVGLVRTGSRSAYIGAYGGIIVGTLFWRGGTLGRRAGLAVGMTAGLAAFVAVGWATGLWATGLWDRLVDLWERGFESGGRLWMWGHAFRMGAEHPLLGVGIDQYRFELIQYGRSSVTHNEVLTHFAEMGIPGLLLYLGFLAAVFAAALRVRDPWLRAGLAGLFVAANVASLGNPSSYSKHFWFQMAACALGGVLFAAEDAPRPDRAAMPSPRGGDTSGRPAMLRTPPYQ